MKRKNTSSPDYLRRWGRGGEESRLGKVEMVNCAKEVGRHPKQVLQNVTDLIWVLEYVNVAFCMFELFPNLKK